MPSVTELRTLLSDVPFSPPPILLRLPPRSAPKWSEFSHPKDDRR
jgi:hypothetical protein